MNFTPRVIVLDDDSEVRSLFRSELTKRNLNVQVAKSVPQLLERVVKDHFDASILDIRLSRGGKEGLSALEQLKQLRPDMYIEVQTAYKQYIDTAYSMGADQVFLKPDGYTSDAADRIKNGILKKRLLILASMINVDPQTLINNSASFTNEYEIVRATVTAGILAKVIPDLKIFLVSRAIDYHLNEKDACNLEKDVIEFIAKHTMGIEISGFSGASKLADDENYRAYLDSKSSLIRKYPGQYVAFVNGQFAIAEKDKEQLFEKLDELYQNQDAFVKKILDKRVIHLNSPKSIKK